MNLAVRVRHAGPHQVRARQGAEHAAALHRAAGQPVAADRRLARLPRRRHPPQHPAAVPRHAGRRRAPVPHHPRHRHGDPGRRSRRSARDRRSRAEAAALRRAVAAAGRSRHAEARVEHPDRELRGRRRRRRAHHRSARLRRLARALQAAPAGAEVSGVHAAHAVGAGRNRQGVRSDRRSGFPDPPSVRFVHLGRDVPARRRRRSARRHDQDHAVSHRRQLAAGRSADRRPPKRASRWRCWSS